MHAFYVIPMHKIYAMQSASIMIAFNSKVWTEQGFELNEDWEFTGWNFLLDWLFLPMKYKIKMNSPVPASIWLELRAISLCRSSLSSYLKNKCHRLSCWRVFKIKFASSCWCRFWSRWCRLHSLRPFWSIASAPKWNEWQGVELSIKSIKLHTLKTKLNERVKLGTGVPPCMSGSAALLELELLSLGMPTQHRVISVCIRVSKTRHVKLDYNLFS